MYHRVIISPYPTLQPLEAELNATSEQVRKASREVSELQAAVLLAREAKVPQSEGSEDISIEPVRAAVPGDVNSDVLISFSPEPTPSCDQSCDPSCDPLINPSLDMLNAELEGELLEPEKLDTPLTNSHKPEQSSQYFSQELF